MLTFFMDLPIFCNFNPLYHKWSIGIWCIKFLKTFIETYISCLNSPFYITNKSKFWFLKWTYLKYLKLFISLTCDLSFYEYKIVNLLALQVYLNFIVQHF